MLLNGYGLCTLLTKRRGFLQGQQGHLSHATCIVKSRVRHTFHVTLVSCHGLPFRSPYSTAADEHHAHKSENAYLTTTSETRPWTFPSPLELSELRLATPHNTRHCTGDEIEKTLQYEQAITQTRELVSTYPQPPPERRIARFAAWKKHREHMLLVNRALKDKSQLSYDWRIPLWFLERSFLPSVKQNSAGGTSSNSQLNTSSDPTPGDQGSFRIARIPSRHQNNITIARRIPRPFAWSESTLADYVEDLAESQKSNCKIPRTSQAYSKWTPNITDVLTAFDEIFYSPTMEAYLSSRAYNVALRFYYDYGLVSKARSLFIKMLESKIGSQTDTINNVLKGAASSHDLHNFTFILLRGLQRGFKPDGETWNMLLMAITSSKVRAFITQRMWERGVLKVLPTRRGTMRLIIHNELAFHINMRGDRGAFLDHLDERYGKTWLTTSTGNKLLDEYSKRFTLPEALSLLHGMKLRGFVPDEVSLNTLLQHCLVLRQQQNAIETLRSFDHHFGLRPGRVTYETLFLLAWKCRLLNSAKVIWRTACLCGHVTFKMRKLVFQSLVAGFHAHVSNNGMARFSKLAGRFIVGAGEPSSLGPEQHKSKANLAYMYLRNDFRVTRFIGTPANLETIMLKALDLDRTWAVAKFSRTATMQQMLQEGVQMEFDMPSVVRKHIRIPERLVKQRDVCDKKNHVTSKPGAMRNGLRVLRRQYVSARSSQVRQIQNENHCPLKGPHNGLDVQKATALPNKARKRQFAARRHDGLAFRTPSRHLTIRMIPNNHLIRKHPPVSPKQEPLSVLSGREPFQTIHQKPLSSPIGSKPHKGAPLPSVRTDIRPVPAISSEENRSTHAIQTSLKGSAERQSSSNSISHKTATGPGKGQHNAGHLLQRHHDSLVPKEPLPSTDLQRHLDDPVIYLHKVENLKSLGDLQTRYSFRKHSMRYVPREPFPTPNSPPNSNNPVSQISLATRNIRKYPFTPTYWKSVDVDVLPKPFFPTDPQLQQSSRITKKSQGDNLIQRYQVSNLKSFRKVERIVARNIQAPPERSEALQGARLHASLDDVLELAETFGPNGPKRGSRKLPS